MKYRNAILSSVALSMIAIGAAVMFYVRQPATVEAEDLPNEIRLVGTVRDFSSSHPDFGISNPSLLGHTAWSIGTSLPESGEPQYTGGGRKVTTQWRDKDGNYIAPYASDLGLPGGHFDVDVFDEPTKKELYHEHEFDDKFDVTYIDIANDPKLLFNSVIGPTYPNNLRVVFHNPHHASGSFIFEAGGASQTGSAQGGFETTFSPAALTELRVNFVSLDDMRKTKPSAVQNDIIDRDDAFAVRMYDTVSNELVYEIAAYWHYKEGDGDGFETTSGNDACGVAINDTPGTLGPVATGAVESPASFGQWYNDVLGTNQSNLHGVTLTQGYFGVYEYIAHDFFPIDDTLLGNEGETHNSFFTYVINARFTYSACTGQFFEFEGNDDCWVYINGQRVIDIGGAGTGQKQYIALDRLGLVDGEEYPLDFFYAHRRVSFESMFHIRTNLLLTTNAQLPVNAAFD